MKYPTVDTVLAGEKPIMVHEITQEDVGKPFVWGQFPGALAERKINTEEFMGPIQAGDVGKRIYRVGDIYQVENDEQLKKRQNMAKDLAPWANSLV
jgi:hypothetical protein